MFVPQPWALELHLLCERFKTLPRAGGIMDQELFELYMMQRAATILAIYDMSLAELTEQDLRGMYEQAVETAQRLQRIIFP